MEIRAATQLYPFQCYVSPGVELDAVVKIKMKYNFPNDFKQLTSITEASFHVSSMRM
jgi:hypothetical protein